MRTMLGLLIVSLFCLPGGFLFAVVGYQYGRAPAWVLATTAALALLISLICMFVVVGIIETGQKEKK